MENNTSYFSINLEFSFHYYEVPSVFLQFILKAKTKERKKINRLKQKKTKLQKKL